MRIRILLTIYLSFCHLILFAQTVLTAGDIAVIGIKTSTGTQGGNDAVKLVTMVELACNTKFIVTDNNWNSGTNNWFCANDEFAAELTVTSPILAGSVIYIDIDAAGNAANSSTGALTKVSLDNPWGTNFGLNSGGDNVFVLQGTRLAATFIYGLRHNGTFAIGGDCVSGSTPKNNTGLAPGLTLGTSAIQMVSSQDQWHYNCAAVSNTKANLLAAISNNVNWTSAAGQQWNNTSCTFNVLGAAFNQSGSIRVSGAGCGCLSGCNLTPMDGPNCSPSVAGDCTGGQRAMQVDIAVPAGCTYRVYATIRNWTGGCTASGMDSGDQLKVDAVAGAKGFVSGASNMTANDNFTLTGPGTIRVSGTANRADEIIVYRILPSTCSGCPIILPIDMIDFSAYGQKESVLLTWATGSELNNEYYDIERSGDGITYESIGTVNGAGTFEGRSDYQFTDNQPLSEYNYYRIRNVDFDGSYALSNVIAIEFKSENGIVLYPNPVDKSRILNIQNSAQIDHIILYNVWGQAVYESVNPNHTVQLPIDLANGFYTVALSSNFGTFLKKIILE